MKGRQEGEVEEQCHMAGEVEVQSLRLRRRRTGMTTAQEEMLESWRRAAGVRQRDVLRGRSAAVMASNAARGGSSRQPGNAGEESAMRRWRTRRHNAQHAVRGGINGR